MARTFDLAVGVPFALDPYEGERLTIRLEGAPRQMRLTISPTKGGEPIFEKSSFGPMVIIPNELVGLVEGQQYSANLLEPDGDDWAVLATGTIRKLESITPLERAGLYFLVGAKEFSTLTQGEYDALGAYDADTVYWIEETPGKIVRAYRGEYLEEDYGTPTGGDGSGWTPVLTSNPDDTVTLSAADSLVTTGRYRLYTDSNPTGTIYETALPVVLQGVTDDDSPRVEVLGNVAELFAPLVFLGLEPISRTTLEGETIYIPLSAAVTGGKKPYTLSNLSRGVINGTTLEIPQTTFSGEVTFTITDAAGNTTPGFVSVTVTAGNSDITPVLLPSMSPLYEGQTVGDVEFFAEMTALANFTNAASISVTFQGAATNATTVLVQGDSAGFTAIPVDYLGNPKPFPSGQITVEYDVRQVETSDGKARIDVNPLVPDDAPVTLEILDNAVPTYNGEYTFTKADLAGGPYLLAAPFIPDVDSAAVNDILGLVRGLWASETSLSYTYEWERNGAVISGATQSTYLVTDADSGTSVAGVVIASDGTNLPVRVVTAAIPVDAAALSNITMAPVNGGIITSSTVTHTDPIAASFDTGAPEAGKYLFVEFLGCISNSTGEINFTFNGAPVTPWLIHSHWQIRINVIRVDASAGGVFNMGASATASWRGYSFRAWTGTGSPTPAEVGRDSDSAYGILDVSGQVSPGNLIFGMAAQENKGTTGDLVPAGIGEDSAFASQGNKRHEYYSGVATETGTRTITITPTGDGSSNVAALVWKVI